MLFLTLISFGDRLLAASDLANLAITTSQNYGGVLNFTLTAVARENDGDVAFVETDIFSVTFIPNVDNSTASDEAPLTPELDVGLVADGNNVGNEDQALVLDLNATEGIGETLNPIVTVTISNVPAGFTVSNNAIFNPLTNEYSADANDINAGLVTITPPEDFSGFFNITVEAVATAARSTSSGEQTLTAFVDPVADGASISFGPTSGTEDNNITFTVSFGELDNYGSEIVYDNLVTIGPSSAWFYVIFFDPTVAFLSGYTQVLSGDADQIEFLSFQDLTGYYRIPIDLDPNFPDFPLSNDIIIELLENWHGTVEGEIVIPILEEFDDVLDLDRLILSTR